MGESPEIHPHNFSDPLLNGLYSERVGGTPGLAVDANLPYEELEALAAEAECYRRRSPRSGRKFCYAPISYEDMDRERIRALRRCIEHERPDWVEQVRMATLMDNEVYTIVHFSGVPPYPAVAILENMKERGELPE
jgi:hypothetical protein